MGRKQMVKFSLGAVVGGLAIGCASGTPAVDRQATIVQAPDDKPRTMAVPPEREAPLEEQPAPSPNIVQLAEPPWQRTMNQEVNIDQGRGPRLRRVRQSRNGIVDVERWLQALDVDLGEWQIPGAQYPQPQRHGALPDAIPLRLGQLPIVRAVRSGNSAIAIYGQEHRRTALAVVDLDSGELQHAFDFSLYEQAPASTADASSGFATQGIAWAQHSGSTLFVSHYHRTYASASDGKNAYLSALSLETGELLWRSQALVSNTYNFVMQDGWIFTGYGFTDEDDFVYVINARNGEVQRRIPVRSGPEMLMLQGNRLHVRCYNTDYEFRL